MRTFLKHLLQAILFILLIAVTARLLRPVQLRAQEWMEDLKERTISYLEQSIGRQIEYESISPSLLLSLEIRNLTVKGASEGDKPLLTIRKVRIFYSLRKLFGKEPLKAISEIRLENSSFNLDLENDRDILAFFSDRGGTGRGPGILDQITLSGKNLDVSVYTRTERVRFSRAYFSLSSEKGIFQYSLQGKLQTKLSSAPGGLTELSTGLKITGTLDRSLSRAEAVVALKDISTNIASLSELNLDVNVNPEGINCVKIKDRLPFDLKLSYDTREKEITASVQSEDFIPNAFISLGEGLENITPWLDTVMTGRAEFSYEVPSGKIAYKADMALILDNEFLPFPVYTYLTAAGDRNLVRFDSLLVHCPYGDILYEGDFSIPELSIDGFVKKSRLSYSGINLDGAFAVKADMKHIEVRSEDITIRGVSLKALDAEVSWEKKSLGFTAQGSLALPGDNRFSADGTYQTDPSFLELSLQTENMPISEAYRYVRQRDDGIARFLDPFSLTADIFFSTDFAKFSFSANTLRLSDGADRTISAGVSGNDTNIALRGFDLTYGGYKLKGDVNFDLSKKDRFDFSSSLKILDRAYNLSGSYIMGRSLIVRGNNGIDGLALWYGDHVSFRLNTLELPVPLMGESALLTMNARGSYNSSTDWELILRNSSLSSIPIPMEENRLQVSLRLTPQLCTLYTIEYADIVSSLTGSGSLNISKAKDMDFSGWIQLSSPDKKEEYGFIGNLNPKTISGTLSFRNAPLKRLPSIPVSGNVNGEALIWGELKNPDIRGKVSLLKGEFNKSPLSFQGEFDIHDEGMTINNLRAEYKNHSLQGGKGVFVSKNGDFLFIGDYRGRLQNDSLSAQVEFRLKAGPVATKLDVLKVFQRDLSGSLRLNRFLFRGIDQKNWDFVYSKAGDSFKFKGGPENCIETELNKNGNFFLALKAPIPVAFSAKGNLKDKNIDATVSSLSVDISVLEFFVDIPFINFTQGRGQGAVTLKGPVADPDINGFLNVDNLAFDVSIIPEKIAPFSTVISFSGKEMAIRRTAIKAGKGVLTTQINFMLDHWLPLTYTVRVAPDNTGGGTHIKYVLPQGGVEIDGYVAGALSIQGGITDTYIDGNFEVNSCTIAMGALEEDREFFAKLAAPSGRGGQGTNTMVNLNFYTGRRIEFLWPSKAIPIIRTYAATGEKLTFSYDGRNGTYGFKGSVGVKGGEIFYFQRNFYMKQGTIVFNENQGKFDPMLTARAEIREIDSEGEQVRIYLIVDEKPFSRFEPRFESEPSLSTLEIAGMLGLGGDEDGLDSALSLTGDLVSQFAIIRNFEQKVKETFKLDVFSFRTQMIQNVILERVLNQDAENATGSAFGRYLDNTTLFLGKYFSDTLFLQAMFQLRVNNALTNAARVSEGLVLDSEISFEWRTPLFLLNFSLTPDFSDLAENLNQFSIGLSWAYTY